MSRFTGVLRFLGGKRGTWRWFLVWGVSLALICQGGPARAAGLLEKIKDQEIAQVLRLKVGQAKVLRTPFPITRISVANPEIADIVLISEKEIYVNGLGPGITNLGLWGAPPRFTSATVQVEADVTLLKEKLHQLLPREKIAVYPSGNAIVLSGEVSSPAAQQAAVTLAEGFLGIKSGGGGAVEDPKASRDTIVMGGGGGGSIQTSPPPQEKGRVINLLHVGGVQQVMVEVRVAEINRNIGRRLGVNFSGVSGTGNFGVSTIDGLTTSALTALGSVGQPSGTTGARDLTSTILGMGIGTAINAMGGFKAGGILWTMFFAALKEKGLGRILAEPNLVATSGQEASFLAGGEFPVPVPQQFNVITIEYKKFGVGLTFTPTVLDGNKIALKVAPEVSELDSSIAPVIIAGLQIPGLRVRRTSTHVEVKDGQTFAIAGLLSDTHRNIIRQFPLFGDVPILGTLFRSSQYQKNETELVVLATPHLVKPMKPKTARLPTDSFVEPNDFEFYLLGKTEGKKKERRPPPPPENLPPGFGHQPVQ
ncbi:MAG: type II and III secretion system protein family protein [Thermodesulfobacteriota bacterium]